MARLRLIEKKAQNKLHWLRGSGGFSMVEAVVAVGLSAVVGLGVMSISQKSAKQATQAEQNLNLDDYTRSLRRYLTDKNSCNSVISDSGTNLHADLSSFNATKKPPLDIKEVRVLTPSLTGSGREVIPASLIIYFDRKVESLKNAFAIKRTTAMVEYKDGAFIGCSDYEAESEISTFKMACETMGGSFSLETGAAGSEKCDFSTLAPNHKMLGFAKKYICENVYHGVFDGVKCDSMKMPNAQTTGGNIQPNQFLINGNWVKTFTQLCPDQNSFVKSIKSDGSVDCKTIKFCTKCDANCPASGSLCEGPGPAPASAPELDCDANDNYYIDGLNSASATNYCKFSDYSKNSDGTACTSSMSEAASAGPCKYFASGTCSGSITGKILNYPDGTSCGSNKVCMDGVCGDSARPMLCSNGSIASPTRSGCERRSPTGECREFIYPAYTQSPAAKGDRKVNDSSDYPLCSTYEYSQCSETYKKILCTPEKKVNGYVRELSCYNFASYCPGSEENLDEQAGEPKCADGSIAYETLSDCERANPGSNCSEEKIKVSVEYTTESIRAESPAYWKCSDFIGKTCVRHSDSNHNLLCAKPGDDIARRRELWCQASTFYCAEEGSAAGCWKFRKNKSGRDINMLGFPDANWQCTHQTEDPTVAMPKSQSMPGPCEVGNVCTYHYKYGYKEFECQEDVGQCVGGADPKPDPCANGGCVWRKTKLQNEDQCKRNVPECSYIDGKECDGKTIERQCNDHPLPKGQRGCQVNEVYKCVEK